MLLNLYLLGYVMFNVSIFIRIQNEYPEKLNQFFGNYKFYLLNTIYPLITLIAIIKIFRGKNARR